MMEAYFYTNLLENIVELSGRSSPWVGSIRWSKNFWIDINAVDQMLSDKSLLEAGIEVISFFNPLGAEESLHVQAEHMHPGLMSLLEYALHSVGEQKEDINKLKYSYPNFKGLFGYGFVARPVIMHGFVQWLSRVIVFLTTDIAAQEMVWKDSRFEGPAKVIQELYGSPFYPLHQFFGERLVSYYFNARGYKIITLNEYNVKKRPADEKIDEASPKLE